MRQKFSSNYSKYLSKNRLQKYLIKKFYEKIKELVQMTGAEKVFEAGCGEGFSSKEIISEVKSLFVGMDLVAENISFARKNCKNAYFFEGSIYNLPLGDNSFELVLCLEVLEHLKEPSEALNELLRVSSKWAILSVPNEPYFCIGNFLRGKNFRNWGNDPEHINHWSKIAFEKFVEKKCKVVRDESSFPWTIVLCEKI